MQQTTAKSARSGWVAGVVFLSLSMTACGGGSGGAESNPGGGAERPATGAVSLVDGRVGDSPFYDDGSANGFADGLNWQQSDGSPVTVTWSPVTVQVDGAPETELAGYRIYYGSHAGNYDYVIELGDPSAQGYRLSGLPDGTWYFAVSAVDAANREGPLSRVTSIRVD